MFGSTIALLVLFCATKLAQTNKKTFCNLDNLNSVNVSQLANFGSPESDFEVEFKVSTSTLGTLCVASESKPEFSS